MEAFVEVADKRGLKDCIMNVCDLCFEGSDGVQVCRPDKRIG